MKISKKNIFYIASVLLGILALIMVFITSAEFKITGTDQVTELTYKNIVIGGGYYMAGGPKYIGSFPSFIGWIMIIVGLVLSAYQLYASINDTQDNKVIENVISGIAIGLFAVGGILIFTTEAVFLSQNLGLSTFNDLEYIKFNGAYIPCGIFALIGAGCLATTYFLKD